MQTAMVSTGKGCVGMGTNKTLHSQQFFYGFIVAFVIKAIRIHITFFQQDNVIL